MYRNIRTTAGRSIVLLLLACLLPAWLQATSHIPPFRKGERVVFTGNSITHGGHYHSFIWLYYMTRFPDRPITIMNAGIGGESAWDIKDRLDTDVFDRKPTYVTLTFGMNDTGYDIFMKENARELARQRVDSSLTAYREIEKRLLRENKVTKVLIGGSPYDETSRFNGFILHGKNDAIREIVDAQRASAERNGWGFVDFNTPMLDINRREQAKDSTFTFCRIDRIHPDNDGQMVMAYEFLKAQGMAGKEVADVQIDAARGKTTVQKNCRISKLQASDEGVTFRYLAKSLPYPLDSIPRQGWGNKRSQLDGSKLIPFMEEMNQERLKVSGLRPGNYQLLIDGLPITRLSSDELAQGINLAAYPQTPQYRQAMKVLYLNEERFEVEKRFREYLWTSYTYLKKKGLLFADNQEALTAIQEELPKDPFLRASYGWYVKAMNPEVREVWQEYMESIVDKIYQINKPVIHQVELKRL